MLYDDISVYDDKFTRILDAALSQANNIDCPLEEYVIQLRTWKDEIDAAIQAANESKRIRDEENGRVR